VFEAHQGSICSISWIYDRELLLTAGSDQRIRLWSINPVRCVGSFGVGKLWKLHDDGTWEEQLALGTSLIELETDFLSPEPEEEIVVREIRSPEKNDEVVVRSQEEPRTWPGTRFQFSLDDCKHMDDDAESIYFSGTRIASKASRCLKTETRSRPKPKNNLVGLLPLIKKKQMKATAKFVASLAAGQRVFRPDSSRRHRKTVSLV
jgi:WD40 repeat protein